MKIENSAKPSLPPITQDLRSARPASVAAGDDVRLSGLSIQLSSTSEGGVFDAAKVSEIKQAIAEGRFTINPENIANRLLSVAKEMVDAQHQA